MLRERILPQSEVIRAIVLEDSPCCGVPHLGRQVVHQNPPLVRVPAKRRRGHLVRNQRDGVQAG